MWGGRIGAEAQEPRAGVSVAHGRSPSIALEADPGPSRDRRPALTHGENLAAWHEWSKSERVVFDFMAGGAGARAAPAPVPQAEVIAHSPSPSLQAKLEVGAVDTPEEREADAVAARVMAGSAPPPMASSPDPTSFQVQRLSAAPATPHASSGGGAPRSVGAVLNEPGTPLDPGTRSFMEPRFGHSFAEVRIHDGAQAAASAAQLGAAAYTVSSHVVFGHGHYAPGTTRGQSLLAHELTHVVQQRAAGPAVIQRKADEALAWWHKRAPAVLEAKKALNRHYANQRGWKPLEENDYVDGRTSVALGAFQHEHKLHHRDNRLWQETLDALTEANAAHAPAPAAAPPPTAVAPATESQPAPPATQTKPAEQEADHPEDANVSLGVLDNATLGWVAKQVLGDATWPVLREFMRGAKAGLLSAPPEQIQHIFHKFEDQGLSDQWDYAKGAFVGILKGLWSSVTGLFEAAWTLIKLPYDISEFLIVTMPELGRKYGPRVAAILAQGSWVRQMVKDAIDTFLHDPVKAMEKVGALIDAMKGAVLGKVRSLGRSAAGKLLEFLDEPWYEFGVDVGKLVGQVLFEVILAVASDGIATIVKGALEVAGRLAARLATEFIEVLRGAGRLVRQALTWIDSLGSKLLEGAEIAVGSLKGVLKAVIELLEGLMGESAAADTGVGGIRMPVPDAPGATALESRAVRPPGSVTVEDLRTPRIHPSNMAKEAEALDARAVRPSGGELPSGTREALGEGPTVDAMRETGKAGAGMAARPQHHVFPKEERRWFQDHGFVGETDIDEFCVELEQWNHQAIHGGGDWRLGRTWAGEWNNAVMGALRDAEEPLLRVGRKLTQEQVYTIVKRMTKRYDILMDFVRWRGA